MIHGMPCYRLPKASSSIHGSWYFSLLVISVVSLWDDTAKLAKDEGKTPVIALCEKNRPGFWIMVHSDDLKKIKDKE